MKNSLRKVYCQDSLKWLPGKKFKSIITSLPDLGELKLKEKEYLSWLTKVSELLINSLDDKGCIIFFQTNRKYRGCLIDKFFCISSCFYIKGYNLVFHKIVLRCKPEGVSLYRPGFSNMFCFSKTITAGKVFPDVFFNGKMIHDKAIGLNACDYAIDFIKRKVDTKIVVDPFCGHGSVLAMANYKGLKSIGVDVNPKNVELSRQLVILDKDVIIRTQNTKNGKANKC